MEDGDQESVILKTSTIEKTIPWSVLEHIDIPYFNSLSNLRGQVDAISMQTIRVDHVCISAWEFFLDVVCNYNKSVSKEKFPTENAYEVYNLFLKTFPFSHPRFVEVREILDSMHKNTFYYYSHVSAKTSEKMNLLCIRTTSGLVNFVRHRIEYYKSLKMSDDLRLNKTFEQEMSHLFANEVQKSSTGFFEDYTKKFKNEMMVLKADSDRQAWNTVMILFQQWCMKSGNETIMNTVFDVVSRPYQYEERLDKLSRGLIKRSMLSNQCVLSGGALITCMFQDIDLASMSPDSDIDLWVSDETKLLSVLTHFEKTYENHVRFLKNGPVTTILVDDFDVSIQLIACYGSGFKNPQTSVQDVVFNFDLDYIKAYDDGQNVYVTAECNRAWEERRVSTGFVTNPKSRLDKAREKGFEISKEYESKITFTSEKKSRYDFYYPSSSVLDTMCKKRRRVDVHETKYVDNLLQKMYPASTIFKRAKDVVDAYEKSKTLADFDSTLVLYNMDRFIDWTSVKSNFALAKLDRVSKRHAPISTVVLFETPIKLTLNNPTDLYVNPLTPYYTPCYLKISDTHSLFFMDLADVVVDQLETSYPAEYKIVGIKDKTEFIKKACKTLGFAKTINSKLSPSTEILVESSNGSSVKKSLEEFVNKACSHGIRSTNTEMLIYGVCLMKNHINFVTCVKKVVIKKNRRDETSLIEPPPVLRA
jgi:hypothetical protein